MLPLTPSQTVGPFFAILVPARGRYRFEIVLQGPHETVFFDV